jgi:lipopolysaccharide assembly protein A
VQLIWIASLFFAVVIALFAVQNTTPVSVSFLVWRLEAVAVSALVLAAAALGALLTYLFGLRRGIQHRLELRGNRATIRDQEALIADLRARVRELEGAVEAKRPEIEATEPVGPRAVESAGPKPQLAAPDPEARTITDAAQTRTPNP